MKKKSGLVSQHTGSDKMSKDEDSALSTDVKKEEIDDLSTAIMIVGDDGTPSIHVPRRSARMKQLQDSCISRRGRTDKSSLQEKTTASPRKPSAADVHFKMRNRELENLVVERGNSSSICDEGSSMTQPCESTAPLEKKKELNDIGAMLVHSDKTPQASPEPKSLFEESAKELEESSARDVTSETSIQMEILTSDVLITNTLCPTSAVEAPDEVDFDDNEWVVNTLRVATRRREMVDASQKAVMTTAPLKN